MDDGNYNWQDEKDIAKFADDWRQEAQFLEFRGEPDPMEELRHRLQRGDFMGRNKQAIELHLKKYDARAYKLSADAQVDREDRAVAAAERSARWAGWAVAISLAALVLAGWPYIKSASGASLACFSEGR